MPEFLAYRELVLHSPPVLLPRTARLYAKLASGLGQAPAFLAYGELVLHSPPDLPASLQCKLGNNSEGIACFDFKTDMTCCNCYWY